MKYIVGLGNPGEKYQSSRHNIGWQLLDQLVAEAGCTELSSHKYWQAQIAYVTLLQESVCLVYPQTYMNRSGETVAAILKDDPDAHIIIVHDDVALPLGTVKISTGKGHGGHNGLRSIFTTTKQNDFDRVRLGVAGRYLLSGTPYVPTGKDLPKHVLGNFSFLEKNKVQQSIKRAAEAVTVLVDQGVDIAMNTFNR